MMLKHQWGPFIVSILILCIGGVLVYVMYQNWMDDAITVDAPVVTEIQQTDETPDLKSIIHKAEKNVMLIEGETNEETVKGSGFLYNDKGDIITNAHVVEDADLIHVRTANARVYPAALIGISEETDVAVVRVPQLAGQVPLENAEKEAEIGDEIIALGSPHGFQNTATVGIISGTERNFTVDGYTYENVYQISAQITDGNSGGPLIDRNTGQVIGINSVGTQDGTLGFSIPINEVMSQVKQWSKEAKNDQLEFAGTEQILKQADTQQLKTDASYLLEYFFDSLKVRDYVEAYTTLGSDIQKQTSYADFRKQYMQTAELTYENLETSVLENDNRQVKTTATVTIKSKQPEEESLTTDQYTYQFVIGYENEQLKLLKRERSLNN